MVVSGGDLVGLELAQFLAERHRQVTVLDPDRCLGADLALPRRSRALHEARAHGISLHADATLVSIEHHGVVWVDADGTNHTVDIDDVIIATGTIPDPEVATVFDGLGAKVEVIGDAADVAHIHGAIRSGSDLGRAL